MGILNVRIKEMRKKAGMTLLEVANKIGVEEATMQRYESGKIKRIDHETIQKLAKIFNCHPSYLMGWEEESLGYYLDDEVAAMAQELYDNPELRLLFDTTRKVKPEDLKFVAEMVKRMSGD